MAGTLKSASSAPSWASACPLSIQATMWLVSSGHAATPAAAAITLRGGRSVQLLKAACQVAAMPQQGGAGLGAVQAGAPGMQVPAYLMAVLTVARSAFTGEERLCSSAP